MTHCDKIQQNLAFWVLGELTEVEAREVADHVGTCPACGAEAQAYREILGVLQAEDLPRPGTAFFDAQREAVLAQVRLAPELAEALPDVELDPEAVALSRELKHLLVADPGELFFQRQFKAIRRSLREETGEGFWAVWARPLAVAASLFFLVLGVARITHRHDTKFPPNWNLAIQQLAEEEDPSLEDIDELSPDQLQLLANNLEGAILVESGDQMIEEAVDFDDLNEQELDLLIQRLETGKNT